MTTFDDFFPIVAYERGPSYLDARNVLLSLTGVPRDALMARLPVVHAAAEDWETRLGAEILLGWSSNRDDYVMCAIYARGDRPGPRSIVGYRSFDRAKDIAARGTAMTPRLLELLLKTEECTGDEEIDSLFEALALLRDPRSADAMAFLADSIAPRDLRGGALRVLAALGDARTVEPALKIIRGRGEPLLLRTIAMRALAAVNTAGGGALLLDLLEQGDLPRELRQVAAEALYRRADPTTRAGLLEALTRVRDASILPTLVLAIGEVGTSDDALLLANYAAVAPETVAPVVRKTIARIEWRLRQQP